MPLIWMEAGLPHTWLKAHWPATHLISGERSNPSCGILQVEMSGFIHFYYCFHPILPPPCPPSKADGRWRCSREVSTILCVHERRCQPANCSGHGECVNGRCRCQKGWQGVACDSLLCEPPTCGPHGVCSEGR